MDWAKLIDKFYKYIFSVIPGSVVLAVGVLNHPKLWDSYWNMGYLGYQTKLVMLILVTMILGSTVDSLAGAVMGGITGGVGSYRAEKARQEAAAAAAGQASSQAAAVVAYWRDPSWRNLVTAYMGKAAPENLHAFVDQNELDQAMDLAGKLPQPEQAQEMGKIARRANAAILQQNDETWMAYWNHLHAVTTPKVDSRTQEAFQLVAAFGGASWVVVLSALWTPQVRHWWILLPCIYFVFVSTFGQFMFQARVTDPAQLFEQQWQYMRAHVGKGEQASDTQ